MCHSFHKMKIPPPPLQKKGVYQPMNMNSLGFIKAVNFKFLFSNYLDVVQRIKIKKKYINMIFRKIKNIYINMIFRKIMPVAIRNQGRIQDLWLGGGGGAWVGEGSEDRLRSPAGPRQSPGRGPRGPRGAKPPEALEVWGITDIYLNDNFEPTTPFLSDQKNLTLSLNFVG